MKHFLTWAGAVLIVLGLGFAIARAYSPLRHPWRHHGPLGGVARELNLNSTQKSQIKTIWQAERPTVAALVRELVAENKEMDSGTAQRNFDQGKVQAIADRQGATIAKLMVEKEKLRSQIYTSVLTPAQRQKADRLQDRWHARMARIASRLEQESGSAH